MGSVLSRSARANQLEAEVRDAMYCVPTDRCWECQVKLGEVRAVRRDALLHSDEHGPTATARLVMVREGAVGAGSGGRVPHSVAARQAGRAARGRTRPRDAGVRRPGRRSPRPPQAPRVSPPGTTATATAMRRRRTEVVEDVWAVASGDLARLASASRLAVTDWRDLRLAADELRGRG